MAEAAAPAGGRVVAPDGTVSYDFDGHISAKGVDLPAANLPVSTPEAVPTVSGISWVPLGGGVVARMWADTRGLDLYADGSIMARTAGSSRMVLDNAGDSDYAFAGDVTAALADVVRGDPGLRITGQFQADFTVPGSGFTDVDINYGVPLTGNIYLPLWAILDGGAADRCNAPAYAEAGPTTLRFRISTDFTGALTGALITHLLYYG